MTKVRGRKTVATHKICSLIGIGVSAKLLKSIGCIPAAETKTGVFWYVSDINHIISSIIHHLKHVDTSTYD